MLRAGDSDGYPTKSQSVAVHYDAFLPGGKMWDSSRKRKRPLRFRLGEGQVIPGLDEGLMQLSLGSRARLVIPAELAYGDRGFCWDRTSGKGLVPPGSSVEFDIELLEII